MKITFNDEQMLEMWRTAANLEPSMTEASVERFDSVDINGKLRSAMRAWYLDYLAGAPLDLVPVSELSQSVKLVEGYAPNEWILKFLSPVLRVVEIAVEGIGHLGIVDPDIAEHRPWLHRLANRFVRHGSQSTAIYRPGDDRAVLNLPTKTPPVITTVRGVAATDDDVFVIDERVLPAMAVKARECVDDSLYSQN